MTSAVKVYPGNIHRLKAGGTAQPVVFGDCAGAVITNPASPADQGIATAEPIYLSFFGDAGLAANNGTVALQPGDTYNVPANVANPLTVNAATTSHSFSVFIWQPAPTGKTEQVGAFPPNETTCRTTTLPSYLYQQYNDDDDLAAFVSSYNQMTQNYVDTFNDLNLPIYTHDNISGLLLDWVGNGLYGYARPVISSGNQLFLGPLDTYEPNVLEPDQQKTIVNKQPIIATDDQYKRSITWHFLKGDGKVFNVRWLKRRITRWLLFANGIAGNPNQTYQISVSFGLNNEVTITFLTAQAVQIGGSIPDLFMPNQWTPDATQVTENFLTPLPNTREWKEAVEGGLLEMPFQYRYQINIETS